MVTRITRFVLHTIPLLRLLPGRPRCTFFSSSFFLGGILVRWLARETENVLDTSEKGEIETGGVEMGLSWDLKADPAAVRMKSRLVEVKV